MWIKKGVNDVSVLNGAKDKAISDQLINTKTSLDICQFVIDVVCNTGNIQSTAQVYPGVYKQIEELRLKCSNDFEQQIAEARLLIKQAKNQIKTKTINKLNRMVGKFEEKHKEQMKQIDDYEKTVAENPFVLCELQNYDQEKIWSLIAGFKIMSLSDRNLNLVDHTTWEQIFQGKFEQTHLNNKKSVEQFVLAKFDTEYENSILSRLKPELFDRKNKKREAQLSNLSEETRDLVNDCFDNGKYMDVDVLKAVYICMRDIVGGKKPNEKSYNYAIRYMSDYDINSKTIKYVDQTRQEYVFKFVPQPDNPEGVLEIDITGENDAQGSRRVMYYNPFHIKTSLCSEDTISEYVLTEKPKCYTSQGELLNVVEGQQNRFVYQYVKLLRNNFAHGAYNIYQNPNDGYWVCTGNEGAELHYPYVWLQNLQGSFNTIEQVLFGEHSENRGSLQYYNVVNANTNIKTNNIFTIPVLPPIGKGFESRGAVLDYLTRGCFYTVEVNDDVPHSEVENLIKNIAPKLEHSYVAGENKYRTMLNTYICQLEKSKTNNVEILRLKGIKEKEFKAQLEQELYNKICIELGRAKLFDKQTLKNYVVKMVSANENRQLIRDGANHIADMMADAGCFKTDSDKKIIMSASEQSRLLCEALNVGSDCNLKLSQNKGNDVVDYTQLGWLMDIVADSDEYPACNQQKGGSKNRFGIGMSCVRALSMYKEDVLASIGAFAMYSSLVANGYADAINSDEVKFYGLDSQDEQNLCNINMKELNLKDFNSGHNKKYTLGIKDIKNRKIVISTLRNAVAHGNIKSSASFYGVEKPNDVSIEFMDVKYANGLGGVFGVDDSCWAYEICKRPCLPKTYKSKSSICTG